MKKIIKKMALASVALMLLAVMIGWLPGRLLAVYNQYQATKYNDVTVANLLVRDSGIYDSGGTLRFILGAITQLANGQLSMGTSGVVLSTANTSGFSSGNLYYAYLGGSTNALEGSALIAATPVAGQGVTVTVAGATIGLTNVVGFASSAVSTGSVVGMYSAGSYAMALTTGTVAIGDQLATSSLSAGYLYAPTTGTNSLLASTATCGVALAVGNSAGGRIRIRVK